MQKVFQKTLLASLILSASAFAAESNLLALATNNTVSLEKATTVALNDAEMKSVVGGSYYHNLSWSNCSTGIAQTYGTLTETYQGQNLWVIAEKYGATLSSGYNVYLSAHSSSQTTPTYTYNQYGHVYNTPQVVTNPTTYAILSPYIQTALNTLTGLSPTYK